MRRNIGVYVALVLALVLSSPTDAQTQAQVQQAEGQLSKMTPDQIDAKLKELGMSQADAEAKAAQYGIDLQTYLTKYPASSQNQGGSSDSNAPKQPIAPSITAKGDTTAAAANPVQPAPPGLPPLTPEEARIFGLSFFRSAGGNFQPSPSIADDQYVVGAGDVLKISLWGQIQSTSELTVSDAGRITLQPVGPLLVAGYTLAEVRKRVTVALSQAYAGLVSKPPSIFLDLSLSKLRPIRVFIMGEVQNPGGYYVSNFASVFNSLFVVGGPKASGSLRDVELIRDHKVIAHVDLYDYLLGSPKVNDVRVNENDIIYVPLRGRRASIQGQVLRPFTFEFLPGENLRKLIEFSGGLRPSVYRDRIQVSRIIPFSERVKGKNDRKLIDIDFAPIAEGKKDYAIQNDDIVTLFPILDTEDNYVTIAGEVRMPGTYEFDKLKTIKDLIEAADGVWPTTYMKRAELLREFPDKRLQVLDLDLSKILANDPSDNLPLQKKDKLTVYSIYDINPRDSVTVIGPGDLPVRGQYDSPQDAAFRGGP